VIDAYVRGLYARVQAGERVDHITSVASFFLSRIDAKVDSQLPQDSALRGTLAVASARLAYAPYRAKFAGPEWARLAGSGARRQRPLWASTGTNNSGYSDVLYVADLIGPDVVNTMPEATLRAFADHGEVARTLTAESGAPEAALAAAGVVGVNLSAVASQLEREGVRAFCASYQQLLACIETKLGSSEHVAGVSFGIGA
jgi:transaldolase